jgi:hypothetical protein
LLFDVYLPAQPNRYGILCGSRFRLDDTARLRRASVEIEQPVEDEGDGMSECAVDGSQLELPCVASRSLPGAGRKHAVSLRSLRQHA